MKTLNEYMSLPYKMEIVPDKEEGGYVVFFPELPGCISCGETIESAVANVQDAKCEWIIAALENGIEIQEPESFKVDLTKFMGKGEKLFQTDAQEYIRVMRDNDRI